MESTARNVLRSVKNYTKGYSEIQTKVREATSIKQDLPNNDLLQTISNSTYNSIQFIEIMEVVDKRLNDKGKYWRHVYKSLILLDYMLRYGSEQVVSYSKQNLYIVKTLKEFQFIDEAGRDRGLNVRQKAKDVTDLLTDLDKLNKIRSGNSKGPRNNPSESSYARSSQPSSYSASNVQSTNEEERQLRLALKESEKDAVKRLIPENYDEDKELEKALRESAALNGTSGSSIPDDDSYRNSLAKNNSNNLLDLSDAWIAPQQNMSGTSSQFNNMPNQNIGFNTNNLFGQNSNMPNFNNQFGANNLGAQNLQYDQFNNNMNNIQSNPINSTSSWDNNPDLLGLGMQNGSTQPVSSINGTYNPFAASSSSSHPFSATGAFGNVYDSGASAKPLPAGIDLSGPGAKLAEIARNSEKIDPFANLANISSSSGGISSSAQPASSNPFASSSPQPQNFNANPINTFSSSNFISNNAQQQTNGYSAGENLFGTAQTSNILNSSNNSNIHGLNSSTISPPLHMNNSQFLANPFSSTQQSSSLANSSTQPFDMIPSLSHANSTNSPFGYNNAGSTATNQPINNQIPQNSNNLGSPFNQQAYNFTSGNAINTNTSTLDPFSNIAPQQQQHQQQNFGNSQNQQTNQNLNGANLFL
ncbi:Epsin-3 [Smittium culicis]|uniref:Epsin-3 n=1 Tax=Smittium culicis TaxID=133412 RepID=A0A1R1YE20_9FUNG|nr:Epsin-3 [Smittium culicis]